MLFRKLKSVDRKKMPLTTKIILHFHFHFKVFPEKERERKRERAHTRGEETFQSVRRSPANSKLQSTPISRAPVRRQRSEIAPSRDHAVDCDLAIDDAISRSVNRDLAFARSRRRDRDLGSQSLMIFFLGLSFPSSFPNTKKYFPENFLKCNQTHENIFLSGNAFTQTKHSLNLYFF